MHRAPETLVAIPLLKVGEITRLTVAGTQASRHKICADRGMQRIDRSFYLFNMGHNIEADISPHAIKKGFITAIRMQLLVGDGKRW